MAGSRLAWQADVNRIDRERILRGLSQQKLARVACVDPGTLSDLLGCRRRPNLGTLSALCQALGMNLGDVIQFEDS
jgi:transcriptional regulator with XRE-family HTH domain